MRVLNETSAHQGLAQSETWAERRSCYTTTPYLAVSVSGPRRQRETDTSGCCLLTEGIVPSLNAISLPFFWEEIHLHQCAVDNQSCWHTNLVVSESASETAVALGEMARDWM